MNMNENLIGGGLTAASTDMRYFARSALKA